MIARKLWEDVQRHVLLPEKKKGVGLWWVRIVAGRFSIPGLPDVFLCYEGRFLAWELKRDEADKLRPKQRWIMQRIKDAGGLVGTVRSVEDARALVAEARRLEDLTL